MSNYERNATRAVQLLDEGSGLRCSSELIEEFLICVALLAEDGHPVSVATVLEFIDARQHVMVEANEAAGAMLFLLDRGFIQRKDQVLAIPAPIWSRLPRKRKRVDGSSGVRSRWRALTNEVPRHST